MDEKENTFLINAALGTDLLTSYASASEDKPPRSGCLAVVIVAVAIAWLVA